MAISISQRDLVFIRVPFTDSPDSKPRPVVVMSKDNYNSKFKDFIGIPLTTNLKARDFTLLLTKKDMENGILYQDSFAKVDRISTLNQSHIIKKFGRINEKAHNNLKNILFEII